jgi:hypothetical protein
MRRPFYRKQTGSWYITATMADGSTKQVRLSSDREEAFKTWQEHYQPREADPHQPVGTREVVVVKTVTKTVVKAIPKPASESAQGSCQRSPKPVRKQPENVRGRYSQFERLLLLVELLSPLRRGAKAGELFRDACDLLGRNLCEKTIQRDLAFLEQAGVVETDDGRRFRWNGASVRAVLLERMAEKIGDRLAG